MSKQKLFVLLLLFSLMVPIAAMATIDLGGVATSAPAVASWSKTRLDVFIRGKNNHLWHRPGVDGKWYPWEDLGGDLLYDPAAVSWGEDRIDILAVGSNRHMWHIAWMNNAWSKWHDMGGAFQGSPAVTSWSENRLDVFAQGLNSHVWHLAWDGKAWSDWEDIGGEVRDGVAAVSWGSNRIDVVARSKKDSSMVHRAWSSAGWSDWVSLGGEFSSAPGIASPRYNRLNVFGRGMDGKLWTRIWDGKTWDDWTSLGTDVPSTPVVVYANDRIELFTLGPQKQVMVNHIFIDVATNPTPKIHIPGQSEANKPSEAAAYNLGVGMGLASFQLSVLPQSSNGSFQTFDVAHATVKSAASSAAVLKSTVPAIDSDTLSKIDVSQVAQATATVVNLRGQYSGVLEKISPRLGNAYALGVHIGIAEGQASNGEAARNIVLSSIQNAIKVADALGLDSGGLKGISDSTFNDVPMNEIHQRISELRGKYSALL